MTVTNETVFSFTHEPEVAFRGARTYVHSTTLYAELLAGAEAAGFVVDGAIELRVRQLMTYQPILRYSSSPGAASSGDAPGTFRLQAADVLLYGDILNGSRPVSKCERYDETSLAAQAVHDGQAIEATNFAGTKPFEIITSLNLQLHHRLFSLPEDRKWYLARIALDRRLTAADARRVRIEMVRTLGQRMTRAAILTNGRHCGIVEYISGPVRVA